MLYRMIDHSRNHALNFLKGIACLLVIQTHFKFPGETGYLLETINVFIIPLFCMISGYYAYSRNGNSEKKILRRMLRILRLTLTAIGIYFVFELIMKIIDNNFKGWVIQFFSIKEWIKMLVFSNFDIINAGHLWFLGSLVYSYVVLYLMEKYNIRDIVYKLLPLMFILKCVVCMIMMAYGLTWHVKGNALIGTMPYVILGNYLAYNKSWKYKISSRDMAYRSAFGMIIVLIFAHINSRIDLTEIGSIICGSFLFMLAAKNGKKLINAPFEVLGDTYSLNIYIIHVIVGRIFIRLGRYYGISDNIVYLWVYPLLTIVITILVSIIVTNIIRQFYIKRSEI